MSKKKRRPGRSPAQGARDTRDTRGADGPRDRYPELRNRYVRALDTALEDELAPHGYDPDDAPELTEIRQLLAEATYHNVNWTGEERVPRREVLRAPELRRYTEFRPAEGDFGFAVYRDEFSLEETPLGVVWVLNLPAASPGFGFVRAGVPELGVTVQPGQRGRGLGGALVRLALDHARRRGFEAVSLSVEDGNPSRRIYERAGFVDADDAAPGTMIAELTPGAEDPEA